MTNGNGHTDGNGGSALMSAVQFAAYMEKRLALEDAIEVLGREGTQLRLHARGGETTTDLSSFYDAYVRDPAQLDIIVRNFVMATLGITPDREVSDFAELADRIF